MKSYQQVEQEYAAAATAYKEAASDLTVVPAPGYYSTPGYSAADVTATIAMHRKMNAQPQNWRKWPGQSTDPIEQEIIYLTYKDMLDSIAARRPEGEWDETITKFTPTVRENEGDSTCNLPGGHWASFRPGRNNTHIWNLICRGMRGEDVPPDIAKAMEKAQLLRVELLESHVEKIAKTEAEKIKAEKKAAAEAEQRAYEKSDDYKRAQLNAEIARCSKRAKQLDTRLKKWTKKLKTAQRKLARLEQK